MKSELKFWRWAAVIAVLALGIVGSIAVAAPKGGGGGNTSTTRTDDGNGPGLRFHDEAGVPGHFGGRGPGGNLSDLAKELGVTTTKLRSALDAVHSDLGPPTPPANGQPPSKSDIEKRCTQ
jgi:hypothetical protein